MMRAALVLSAITAISMPLMAEEPDSIAFESQLNEVVVTQASKNRLTGNVTNSQLISAQELTRAACCNLGESFTTNPSVDVSYTDASTGARQIRLLGLSGTYVQMLTENIPNFRGASSPYALGYMPGPWMQSIQVSKGASSVKNGYESITGQINIEMKKPQLDPSLAVNGYVDHKGKVELNADGNIHLGDKWSGGLLVHGENAFASHDENGDGFLDMPRIRQISLMNRWARLGRDYVFQAAVKYLGERRTSGQDTHHGGHAIENPYTIGIDTHRLEFFTKNAYIFDHENDGNVALIVSGTMHNQDARYGMKRYDVRERDIYASLMFERKWNDLHALSTGVSYNFDHLGQHILLTPDVPMPLRDNEAVTGAYAQYTLNLDSRFIAMAGMRYDYSNRYGSMFTPRMHLRWNPDDNWSVNASAGRGYRTPHPWAEYNYLMASSRNIIVENPIKQESAWNFGASASHTMLDGALTLAAEYYYTTFTHQLCVNFDRDPHAVYIYDLAGHSHSHAFQVEADINPGHDLKFLLAYRLTDVKCDYGSGMQLKPLTSRSKGLLTVSYEPNMGLWQFDASLSVNGAGRIPAPYTLADGTLSWSTTFPTYCTLNIQAMRNFRNWSVYIGGENLTGYTQKNPIIGAANPWGNNFDSTMIYGPLHGAVVYAGFRFHITKYI